MFNVHQNTKHLAFYSVVIKKFQTLKNKQKNLKLNNFFISIGQTKNLLLNRPNKIYLFFGKKYHLNRNSFSFDIWHWNNQLVRVCVYVWAPKKWCSFSKWNFDNYYFCFFGIVLSFFQLKECLFFFIIVYKSTNKYYYKEFLPMTVTFFMNVGSFLSFNLLCPYHFLLVRDENLININRRMTPNINNICARILFPDIFKILERFFQNSFFGTKFSPLLENYLVRYLVSNKIKKHQELITKKEKANWQIN